MKKTIGVIGLWHLGCVLCAAWYRLGNKVIGFDYDKERVDRLNNGEPPLFEPNLSETLSRGLLEKSVRFSTDLRQLAECDCIFLSYDTPVSEDDSSDTSILTKSVSDVSSVMKNDSVLIVSSQSPAGFCRQLRDHLKNANTSLELACSPENLRLGEAIDCYLNPGRIILGTAAPEAEKKCRALFSCIQAEIVSMNLESAEMVKHGINSFLSSSIVFANQLADLCEMTGARIADVIRGMKTDPRIGSKAYLSPGIGFSGGTLGRDLKVLDRINEENCGDAKLFGMVHRMNGERKHSIVRRIRNILGGVKAKKICFLGITYKPGTSTLRRSLPLEIVRLLLKDGAVVSVFDPKADYSELTARDPFLIAGNIPEAADAADMLVLATEWSEFKRFDWAPVAKTMRRPVFFDTRNFLDKKTLSACGFQYFSIGESG